MGWVFEVFYGFGCKSRLMGIEVLPGVDRLQSHTAQECKVVTQLNI